MKQFKRLPVWILLFPLLIFVSCAKNKSNDNRAGLFLVSSLLGSSTTTTTPSAGATTGGGSTGGTVSPGGTGSTGSNTSTGTTGSAGSTLSSLDSAKLLYSGLTEDQAHSNLICDVAPQYQSDSLAIAKTYPEVGSVNVPVNSSFVVYFNKPLHCDTAASGGNIAYGKDMFPFTERSGYNQESDGSFVKDYRSLAEYYKCECNRLEVIPVRNFIPDEEYFMEIYGLYDTYGKKYATLNTSIFPGIRTDFLHFKTAADCAADQPTAMGKVNPALADKTLSICTKSQIQDATNVPLDSTFTFTFNQSIDCNSLFTPYTTGAPLFDLSIFGFRSDGTTALEKFNFKCSGNTITISPCQIMGDSHYEVSLWGYIRSKSGFDFMTGITTLDHNLNYLVTNPLRGRYYSLSFITASGPTYTRSTGMCRGNPVKGIPGSGGIDNHDDEEYEHHLEICPHRH